MSFKQNDIIKFTDNTKVLVIDAIKYNDEEYLFVNEIKDDETTLKNKYKVLFVDYQNVTLNKVIDLDLLSALLPQFEYRLKEQLKKLENDSLI